MHHAPRRSPCRRAAALTALVLLSVAAPTLTAEEAASPAAAALERHLSAFGRGDMDAIMDDYAESAVFITPDGVFRGKAAIRAMFEPMVEEFDSPETQVTIHVTHAEGPVAYLVWSAQTRANRYELATDTLYVENDLILYQTFTARVVPR